MILHATRCVATSSAMQCTIRYVALRKTILLTIYKAKILKKLFMLNHSKTFYSLDKKFYMESYDIRIMCCTFVG